ncbi:MAG: Mu transposase C-terminal domain-containing protein, partial [Bacillota bacterium]|nr:Mu transposase C-terminal domain-containing protein [Bacillota bacterium]
KIERFFLTVRKRFLSEIDSTKLKNIDELNEKFFKWLDEDYHRKPHSSLNNLTPLDIFMSQVSKIHLIPDSKIVDEKFLYRIKRTVSHDATFPINNLLFETNQNFAGMKVEVRYDLKWLEQDNTPVLIYENDKKIGEGRRINFHDNAHMRRKGRPSGSGAAELPELLPETEDLPKQTIPFNQMIGGI